jgi:hypothetical protein
MTAVFRVPASERRRYSSSMTRGFGGNRFCQVCTSRSSERLNRDWIALAECSRTFVIFSVPLIPLLLGAFGLSVAAGIKWTRRRHIPCRTMKQASSLLLPHCTASPHAVDQQSHKTRCGAIATVPVCPNSITLRHSAIDPPTPLKTGEKKAGAGPAFSCNRIAVPDRGRHSCRSRRQPHPPLIQA